MTSSMVAPDGAAGRVTTDFGSRGRSAVGPESCTQAFGGTQGGAEYGWGWAARQRGRGRPHGQSTAACRLGPPLMGEDVDLGPAGDQLGGRKAAPRRHRVEHPADELGERDRSAFSLGSAALPHGDILACVSGKRKPRAQLAAFVVPTHAPEAGNKRSIVQQVDSRLRGRDLLQLLVEGSDCSGLTAVALRVEDPLRREQRLVE